MPRKKSTDEVKKPKTKSLFDHINEIRLGKNPEYFKTLSDADKRTWSNYMVCRFLSMQMDIVDSVNELQYYQDKLSPEQFYKLCIAVVPKGRGFFPYIKKSGNKYSNELLAVLCAYFQDSEKNITEYLSLLTHKELVEILSKYGHSDEEIDGMLKKS